MVSTTRAEIRDQRKRVISDKYVPCLCLSIKHRRYLSVVWERNILTYNIDVRGALSQMAAGRRGQKALGIYVSRYHGKAKVVSVAFFRYSYE